MARQRTLKTSRTNYYSRTTIGKLVVEGNYFGFTLEDTVRAFGIKLYGETAISQNPIDGYKIGIRYSARFKREVLVIYTENDGITLKYGGTSFIYTYFHGMNDHEDTLGCVGIAKNHNGNTIDDSLEKELFDLVSPWIIAGDDVRYFVKNLPQKS